MIRNYETPEGTIALIDSGSIADAKRVFTASTNGSPVGTALPVGHPEYPGNSAARDHAVTTIVFCNTAAPTLTNEATDSVTVKVWLVRKGKTEVDGNLIVNSLIVPAGETVFFSEERLVLEGGDMIYVSASSASKLSVTVSALPV